jgi:hypothetical protein
MDERSILLRIVEGPREGWQVMALDEFLQRISLDEWDATQSRIVGMILPPVGRTEIRWSAPEVLRRAGE